MAAYLRPGDTGAYEPWSINVLRLRGGRIAEVTSLIGAEHFQAFGLPPSLP